MKLNRFIKNTDYTSEKQKLDFSLTLSDTTFSVGAGQMGTRSVDFTVPSGAYFENVIWEQTKQTGSTKYIGNFLEYEPNDMMSTITYTVAQVNPTTYRLSAQVMNYDSSARNFTVGAKAKVHLSVAPF